MHAKHDSPLVSRSHQRWALFRRTLTATLILMLILTGVGFLTVDSHSDNLLYVAFFYVLTAVGTGWAIRYGWLIGSRRYQDVHAIYCHPAMSRAAALWQATFIYGSMTFTSSLLLGITSGAGLSFLIIVLDVTSCVGFGLYIGEQLGWDDAEVVGIQQQHPL